jgi:DNA polymerase-3 subunit gamma/tau
VTVLSRCLQFNLKQIPQTQIQARLQSVLDAEGIPAEGPALALLARAAQGSLRDALSLLDQAIAHGAGRVEAASTRAMLGAVDQTYLHDILRALADADGEALIAQADRMNERSLSFESALQELGTLLHRLALVQIVPGAAADDDPDHAILRELAPRFTAEELQLYYQIAVQGRSEIGLAPDEYAGFTMALLRMLAFAPDTRASGGTAEARPARVASRASESSPLVSASAPDAQATTSAPVNPPAVPHAAPAQNASWGQIVEALGVNGMARMLANHCELVKLDDKRIELMLPKAHERLLEKSYQERLKAALQKRYGAGVQVSIAIGEGSGNSPAEIADRERQRNQVRAIAEIEQDPFVRELVENFDARVNESSIKPIQ